MPPQLTPKSNELYALVRFLASLSVLFALAYIDATPDHDIPTIVYGILGLLNGVDGYKLYREINKGED